MTPASDPPPYALSDSEDSLMRELLSLDFEPTDAIWDALAPLLSLRSAQDLRAELALMRSVKGELDAGVLESRTNTEK